MSWATTLYRTPYDRRTASRPLGRAFEAKLDLPGLPKSAARSAGAKGELLNVSSARASVFRGTRVPVDVLFENLADGLPRRDPQHYPALDREEVVSALELARKRLLDDVV